MLRVAEFALVGVGSAVGGMARYGVSLWIAHRFSNTTAPMAFPVATFIANISGCLLLGLLTGILSWSSAQTSPTTNHVPTAALGLSPEAVRLLLGVGVLGGYTTFSTLMLDSVRLGSARGLGNFVASGVGGGIAVVLGQMLARHFYRS